MSDESPGRLSGFRTTRTEAFSDGVFAIAITLLVLEIGVPAGAEDDLLGALVDQWPSYLAYIVSFASIGAVWFAHTVITEYLHHTTSVFARLNLLLLLVVSFLPFPTRLLARVHRKVRARARRRHRLRDQPAAGDPAGLGAVAVCRSHRTRTARPGNRGRRGAHPPAHPGLAGYVVMIVLGLFLPVIAVIGYFAIAVFILVPVPRAPPAFP